MKSKYLFCQVVYEKQKEINEEWTHLKVKAKQRKAKLLDAYELQRFLCDFRDLMSWVSCFFYNKKIS